MEDLNDEFFEISAVSRLTGISPHTLRVWERRYQVVEPVRSDSKRRQYSVSDVKKLALLKTLVDSGRSISSIAMLTNEQLAERVSSVINDVGVGDFKEPSEPGTGRRVVFVGTVSKAAVREATEATPALSLVGEYATISDLETLIQAGGADLLIVERGSVFPEDIAQMQETMKLLEIPRGVLIYRFCPENTVDPFRLKNITAIKSPVGAASVQLACLANVELGSLNASNFEPEKRKESFSDGGEGEIPDRVFDDEQLARIATISSAVECECPQHLSSLLSSLFAFEQYSEQCESRNVEDAAVHAFLHRTTAQCRSMIENAMTEVLDHEGISLD